MTVLTENTFQPAEVDKSVMLPTHVRFAEKYGALALYGVPDIEPPYKWVFLASTEHLATACNALAYAGIVMEDPDAQKMASQLPRIFASQSLEEIPHILDCDMREKIQASIAELASVSIEGLVCHHDVRLNHAALYVSPARWFDGWRIPKAGA
jgi:hypothetical protein